MGKIQISEQRLENLILESIDEVLQEEWINEGLGRWLGNKYQSIRNRIRNFRQDFRAGRGEARAENLRRNPYDQFPEEQRALIAFLSNGNNYSEARKKIIHDLFQKYMSEVQNNPEYSDFLPQRSNVTNSRLYDQDRYDDRMPYFNQTTTHNVNPMENPDISQPVNRNNGQEETGASRPNKKSRASNTNNRRKKQSKVKTSTVKPATVTAKSNKKSKTGKTSKNTSFTSNDINQPQQFSIFDKRWKDNPYVDGHGE